MKKGFLFLMLLLFAFQLYAQDVQQGIQFNHGVWKDVLALAKKENKLVFIDIYTEWCGPCKQMVKEVFPQKEVAGMFNASFVNFKIDAEKGEGIEIARSFGVNAYPTYLFVNGNGELVYKTLGYMPAAKFLMEAAVAIQEGKDPKPLVQWTQEYAAGKRDKAFLLGYILKKSNLQQPTAEALEELIPQLSDDEIRRSRIFASVMYGQGMEFVPGGKLYQYVINNYANIDSLKTGTEPLYNLQYGMRNYFMKHVIPHKREDMIGISMKATENAGKLEGTKDADANSKGLKFEYYKSTKDKEKLIPAAKEYATALLKLDTVNGKFINLAFTLRNITETMYNLVSDKVTLSQAVQWGKTAHEYYPHFSTSGVYAGILYKSGNKEKAIELLAGLINKTFFVNPGPDKSSLFKANIDKMKKGELPERLWN